MAESFEALVYTEPSIEGVAEGARSLLELGGGINKIAAAPNKDLIWRSADAHPLALMLLLLDKYGQEYLWWHPDVLKLTLQRDGIAISETVWNRVLAGRVVLTSPSPWRQWEVFHWVCRALNGAAPNFVYLEKPELGHLVSGWEIMRAVDRSRPTASAVDKFVAASFQDDGQVWIPPPLDFAQRELEQRKLHCTSCEAIFRDDDDIRCLSCGSDKLQKVPYPFAELAAEVRGLWTARSGLGIADAINNLPETPAGSCAYRLLVEWEYARDVRTHLVEQLRMLGAR